MNILTWYGHSTIGINTNGFNCIVDPFFDGNPSSPIKATQVQADYLLITHGHGDHVGDAVEIARRTGAMVISNYEIVRWLDQMGVKNTHSQHIGGGFHHPFGYLKLTMALHGSILEDGTNGGNPAGLLLTTMDGKKVYCAGDTGLFGDMSLIGDEVIDLALLPIGDNYTMGPADALRAVKLISPKVVVPIHFNTWGLISQDVEKWAETVRLETRSIPRILKPGETIEF